MAGRGVGHGDEWDGVEGGPWGGYKILDAVRLDDEEAERQRKWRTEGMPENPADQPVYYFGELVSRGEVARRKMWAEVADICWAYEVADRYFEYCWEVEEEAAKKWQVGLGFFF